MSSIEVLGWTGSWERDDSHANFKERVAESARLDPLAALATLSEVVGIPVGGLIHHVLAEWASAGSAALMELGPTEVERLSAIVDGPGSDAEKIATLHGRLSWLRAGT